MFITDLEKTKVLDATPDALKDKAHNTIQWPLGTPEGAPNFEMRYITLSEKSTTLYHTHPWEHEVFVVSGTGALKTKDGEFPLNAHSFALVLPDEEHQFVNLSDTEPFAFICVVPKGTR